MERPGVIPRGADQQCRAMPVIHFRRTLMTAWITPGVQQEMAVPVSIVGLSDKPVTGTRCRPDHHSVLAITVQLGIQALAGDQLVVMAFFDDLAILKHVGPVRLLHRAEPVGDDQRGALAEKR